MSVASTATEPSSSPSAPRSWMVMSPPHRDSLPGRHHIWVALFEKCLELDLEGIVAKPEASPYRELKGKTTWVKVKNPAYTQGEGRQELFNSRR